MAYVRCDCPHCGTRNVQFTSCGFAAVSPSSEWLLIQCSQCKNAVIIHVFHAINVSPSHSVSDALPNSYFIKSIHPEKRNGDAPEDTPANIDKYFKQGVTSLDSGNYDASGIMFRKTIDIATKYIGGKHQNLAKRIDELSECNIITHQMASWAHEIRLSGNDAAHDEDDFTKEDCEDLLAFTELFLTYCFTLPAKMQRRKAARSS